MRKGDEQALEKKTRTVAVSFRGEDHEEIRKKAEKAGIPMAAFLRRAALETEITEAPGPDVAGLIRALRRAELHLSRAEQEARAGKGFPEEDVSAVFAELRGVERKILEIYGC